jgi:hypothetical protein
MENLKTKFWWLLSSIIIVTGSGHGEGGDTGDSPTASMRRIYMLDPTNTRGIQRTGVYGKEYTTNKSDQRR